MLLFLVLRFVVPFISVLVGSGSESSSDRSASLSVSLRTSFCSWKQKHQHQYMEDLPFCCLTPHSSIFQFHNKSEHNHMWTRQSKDWYCEQQSTHQGTVTHHHQATKPDHHRVASYHQHWLRGSKSNTASWWRCQPANNWLRPANLVVNCMSNSLYPWSSYTQQEDKVIYIPCNGKYLLSIHQLVILTAKPSPFSD